MSSRPPSGKRNTRARHWELHLEHDFKECFNMDTDEIDEYPGRLLLKLSGGKYRAITWLTPRLAS